LESDDADGATLGVSIKKRAGSQRLPQLPARIQSMDLVAGTEAEEDTIPVILATRDL